MEKCTNCERTIGNLEKQYLYQQKVVCGECFERLGKMPSPEKVTQSRDSQTPAIPANPEGAPTPMATASLVMGILGFLIIPCAVLAIIFGAVAPKNSQGKMQDRAAYGAGLGVIFAVMWALFIFIPLFIQ